MTDQTMDRAKLKPYLILSAVTAILLLIASAGGLFAKEVYVPIVPDHLLPGAYGQDLLSLLAVPVLIASLYFAARGSMRGLVMLAGVLGYVAYAYALYAFEGLYSVLFPVYVALLGLSVYALIGILATISGEAYRLHVGENMPAGIISLYFFAIDVLLVPLWLSVIVGAIANGQLASGLNTVYVLDLALLLPAFLVGAIALLQKKAWGYALAGVLLAKAATLGLSIIFGYAFTYAQGFAISWGRGGLFLVLTIAGLILAAVYLRNLRETVDIGR